MTYRGRIQNGAVVLEEPIALAEGSDVECVILPVSRKEKDSGSQTRGMYADLMRFAGKASDLPDDLSTNLDHYLYGLPKK